MMIKELSNLSAPKKYRCEDCGKITICYKQGYITPFTRQLSYEKWLCQNCVSTEDIRTGLENI